MFHLTEIKDQYDQNFYSSKHNVKESLYLFFSNYNCIKHILITIEKDTIYGEYYNNYDELEDYEDSKLNINLINVSKDYSNCISGIQPVYIEPKTVFLENDIIDKLYSKTFDESIVYNLTGLDNIYVKINNIKKVLVELDYDNYKYNCFYKNIYIKYLQFSRTKYFFQKVKSDEIYPENFQKILTIYLVSCRHELTNNDLYLPIEIWEYIMKIIF